MEVAELMSEGIRLGLSFYIDSQGSLTIEGPEQCEALAKSILGRQYEAIQVISNPPPSRPGKCRDCGDNCEKLITGLCYSCGELRKFLASSLPCACADPRRWRYRDGGFYWHCANCELAPDDAVWNW